jgi:hypothetical protein
MWHEWKRRKIHIFLKGSPKKEITGSTRNRRKMNMKSIPTKIIRVSVVWIHLAREGACSVCCEQEDKLLDSIIHGEYLE